MPRLRCTSSNPNHANDRVPLANELTHLHGSVVRCDPAAADRFAEAVVPIVLARLSVRFPRVDPSARLQAVHDAVLWYLRRPDRYQVERARLDVFLGHVAECRLKDRLRHDARTHCREACVDQEMLERICRSEDGTSSCAPCWRYGSWLHPALPLGAPPANAWTRGTAGQPSTAAIQALSGRSAAKPESHRGHPRSTACLGAASPGLSAPALPLSDDKPAVPDRGFVPDFAEPCRPASGVVLGPW